MQSAVDWKELGIEADTDRRKEARLPLTIPIEVTGLDEKGKLFSERTKTIDISESGVSFRLSYRVLRGGILALKIAHREAALAAEFRPLLYQVARSAEESEGWVVGAAKLQQESIWFVAFPQKQPNRPQ